MGKKGANDEAAKAREEEQARQERIRAGTKRIGDIFGAQFNPAYFDAQNKNYLDYATPQLDDQHGEAQKQLTYSLARGGNLDSSVRADLSAELQKKYDTARRSVADTGLTFKTNAMNSVEGARGDLISTLNATGDSEGVAADAIRRAAVLSQPAAYSPLTQMFADFTATLGANSAAEKAYAMAGGSGSPGANLYPRSRSAVVNR